MNLKFKLKKLFKKKSSRINIDEMSTRFSALMDEQKADKKAGFGGCSDIGNFNRPRPIERHNPFTPDRSTSNRTGFGNPRDWHTTHQPPSQNPLNSGPRGPGPNNPQFDVTGWKAWATGGILGAVLADEYNNMLKQSDQATEKKDSTRVNPQFKPYDQR